MPRTHHATIRLRTGVSLLAAGSIIAAGVSVRPATSARAAGGTLLVARDISDGKTMDPGRFYEFTSYAMAANCYDTLVTFKWHGYRASTAGLGDELQYLPRR